MALTLDDIQAADSAVQQPTQTPPGRPATLTGRRSTLRAPRPRMEKFVIEGGAPLSGTITPAGNKNGALPILAACLLTDDEVILRNVPRISDVEAMLGLLESLGAKVTWIAPGEVAVNASDVNRFDVDR